VKAVSALLYALDSLRMLLFESNFQTPTSKEADRYSREKLKTTAAAPLGLTGLLPCCLRVTAAVSRLSPAVEEPLRQQQPLVTFSSLSLKVKLWKAHTAAVAMVVEEEVAVGQLQQRPPPPAATSHAEREGAGTYGASRRLT